MNEKRLLNQLRLGVAELSADGPLPGPEESGEYGTGSIVTNEALEWCAMK